MGELTRRSFFGAVAALVVSPAAAKAAPVADAPTVLWKDRLYTVPAPDGGFFVFTQHSTHHVRRDDGDTILELR